MVDYILNNKEWIFSGIGVAIFIYLIPLLIRHLYKKKHPVFIKDKDIISSNINTISNITKPEYHEIVQDSAMPQDDVLKIIEELEEMPPLHLDDVTKNYVGINVDWLTEYSSASKITKDDDLIDVSLYLISKSFRPICVRCEVNLSDYKQFSILKRNAKIRVVGKIAKFRPYYIELSNVKLFFLK